MAALLQSSSLAAPHLKPSPSPLTVTSSATLHPLRRSSFTPSTSPLRLPRRPPLSLPRRHRLPVPTALDTAASSYGCALVDIARDNGCLEATCSDIEEVAKLVSDPPTLSFFTDPLIEPAEKHSTVDMFATEFGLQPHTASLLHVVLDNNRMDLLPEIARAFDVEYNRETGTEVALVTSVVPLDSTHLAQIAKSVQGFTGAKNVRIRTAIDPELIAGFTIRYGDELSNLIDMSVKKQLEEITSQLTVDVDVELVGA